MPGSDLPAPDTHTPASQFAAQLSLDNLQRVTEHLRTRYLSLRVEGLEADKPEDHRKHKRVDLLFGEENPLANLCSPRYRVPSSVAAWEPEPKTYCAIASDSTTLSSPPPALKAWHLAGGKFGAGNLVRNSGVMFMTPNWIDAEPVQASGGLDLSASGQVSRRRDDGKGKKKKKTIRCKIGSRLFVLKKSTLDPYCLELARCPWINQDEGSMAIGQPANLVFSHNVDSGGQFCSVSETLVSTPCSGFQQFLICCL